MKIASIETECCGTITRCPDGKCLLGFHFGGGAKCIYCNWIWDAMPGVEATPISVDDMKAAHLKD